jgi:membrane-associated phospholipid phosphatase
MPHRAPPSDLRLLFQGMLPHPLLKTVGVSAFITVFFIGYFRLLNFPIYPVTVVPLTPWDSLVPFTPWMLAIYASLWIYVPLAPVLLPTKKELYALGWEAGGVALIGLGIFLFWPTTIPPLPINWADHPGFEFLKTIDASGNACPSLHVAFAVFTAIRVHETLRAVGARPRLHAANWLWCLAIAYSTLAIKQHVILDVIAGAVLGTLGGLAHWTRWLPSARVQRNAVAAQPGSGNDFFST